MDHVLQKKKQSLMDHILQINSHKSATYYKETVTNGPTITNLRSPTDHKETVTNLWFGIKKN